MRVYLSGPITGLPDMNRPAFEAEADRLEKDGIHVVNPLDLGHSPGASWVACMRRDIAELVKCDAIHLLPGWEHSRGAKLELRIALELGLQVTFAGKSRPGTSSSDVDPPQACGGKI